MSAIVSQLVRPKRPVKAGTPMFTQYANSMIAAKLAPSTIKLRMQHIEHLRRVHPDVLAVTSQDLVDYMASRGHLGASALGNIRASLRKFYGWAKKSKLIHKNPALALDQITVPRVIARLAPDDDITLSLIGAPDHEQGMILLGRLRSMSGVSEVTPRPPLTSLGMLVGVWWWCGVCGLL